MATIVVIKGFLAIVHRAGHVALMQISPVMSALALFFIVVLAQITQVFKRLIREEQIKEVNGLAWLPNFFDKVSHTVSPEYLVLTTLQVLLFFLCHSWAGNMIDKNFW